MDGPDSPALPSRPARGPADEPLSPREAVGWLGIALGGFAIAQVVSAVLLNLVARIKGIPSSRAFALAGQAVPPEWVVVTLLLGLWMGFIGAPLVATRLGPIRRRLGLSIRPRDLVGIPIGILAQLVIGLLYLPFRSHLHNFDAPVQKLTGGSTGAGFAIIALLTIVAAPVAEEIFFRGLVLRGLRGLSSRASGRRAAIGTAAAVIVDGLLFGLSHFEAQQFAGLALVGILLSYETLRTGRLGLSIVTHCSFNAVAIATVAVAGIR